MKESNRRIKYALHLDGWCYEKGNKDVLIRDAVKVVPSGYVKEMDETIFCPACTTNLNRIPKDKEHTSNGRDAYFSHMSKYTDIKCDLRSVKPEGKKYDTHEEAQKAIDDENLVIVKGFIKNKPELPVAQAGVYDETPVEDLAGPLSNVPISRHHGETFTLPSKITTVAGICRKFDDNLYKYYLFEHQKHAIRLIDLLQDVASVSEANDKPKLYYGKIESTNHLGQYKRPTNIRMTYLKNNMEAEGVAHFTIKLTDEKQKAHGIGDNSVGRIVLMYGVITESGMGLCFESLEWGEFALLPDKYAYLLE